MTANANTFSGINDPDGSNNSDSAGTTVSLSVRSDSHPNLVFRQSIASPRGARVSGRVVVNNASAHNIDASAPGQVQVAALNGLNELEGQILVAEADSEWIFDFAGSSGFAPGTFQVESGQVSFQSTTAIGFRVGANARVLRFTFQLQ
jgi:hypothetical protein